MEPSTLALQVWNWFKSDVSFSALLFAIIALYKIRQTNKAVKITNRPQVVTHRCRVFDDHVYTYFNETNKIIEPACAYLKLDKSGRCNFNPDFRNDEQGKSIAKMILETNDSKCYFLLWGEKAPKK